MEKQWLSFLEDAGLPPVYGAPSSHVFSVNVVISEQSKCDVYGRISILDKDGTSYEIYSVDRDDPDTIITDNNALSIVMPEKCALSSSWSHFSVHLYNAFDDTSIVDYVYRLDKTAHPEYDQLKSLTLYGSGGTVCIKYATFFAAVICYLEVIVDQKDKEKEKDEAVVDIHGTIVARYGNTYGRDFPGTVLFDEASDAPYSHQLSPTPIDLSRIRVVVPSYSFFRLDVELYDSRSRKPIVNGKADFLTDYRTWSNTFMESEDFFVEVKVCWRHPYLLEQLLMCPKVVSERKFDRKHDGSELIEVFGVTICHNANDMLKICGKVQVRDGDFRRYVPFNRSVSLPEVLSSNWGTIPLEGPSKCYGGCEGFAMGLDLYDIQREVFIKGNLTWSHILNDSNISYYDRRMCSISRGVNCYAAVFYTLFPSAVQARIKVLFMPEGVSDGVRLVYGTIVARYSTEDYTTEYQQSCYQSIIFNKCFERGLQLRSRCNVPLLKSVVAVPLTSSLIVLADLQVLYGNRETEVLKCVAEFDFEKGVLIAPKINGKSSSFDLSVEWSGFYD